MRANIDGTGAEVVKDLGGRPEAIAIDEASCMLYVADNARKDIVAMSLDDSGLSMTLAELADSASGLRLDHATKTLYWSGSAVHRLSLDTLVVETTSVGPGTRGDIAVDFANPLTVYFADDNGLGKAISRVQWGQNDLQSSFIDDWDNPDHVWLPSSLAIDQSTRTLYYGDTGFNKVFKISLESQPLLDAVVTTMSTAVTDPQGFWIDPANKFLYLAESSEGVIKKVSTETEAIAWSLTVPGSNMKPTSVVLMNSSALPRRCFATSTTTTTTTSSATSTTTSTRTTSTTTTSSTTTSSTTTSTTSSTRSSTATATTTTATSSTSTGTTTSATTTTSTVTTLSTTTSTATRSTSTVTSTTSTSSSSRTSTSTTVSSTATSSTSTATGTTTSSTTRTTTRPPTTTRSTTMHDLAIFSGAMTLTVSDAETLVARAGAEPWVGQALREGIAGALPAGVEAQMVEIIDVVASARRLADGRALSAAVELVYELRVPDAVRVAIQLSGSTVSGAAPALAGSLTSALAAAGVPVTVEGAVVPEPTVVVQPSASTTTITATTTTLTSAVATMLGTLAFEAADVDLSTALTAAQSVLASVLEVNLGAVVVEQTQRRRLADDSVNVWVLTYTLAVPPRQAVEAVFKALAAQDSIRNALIDQLVLLGLARGALEAGLRLRSFEEPRFASIGGWPVVDPCGAPFCETGQEARPRAPMPLCEQLTCGEAAELCCQAAMLEPGAGAAESQASTAVLVAAGGGVLALCLAAVLGRLVWRKLKQEALKQVAGGNKVLDERQLAALAAGGAGLALSPRSPPLRLDGDEKVIALLLNDLQGEWRLYDGDQALPGVIEVRQDGYALYDDVHWDDQDLRADATGIYRTDGWRVDMTQSDTDQLEWQKDHQSIVWRRFNGIASFAIGDVVLWMRGFEQEFRATVIGFTDTRVRIELPEGEVHDVKPSMLEIIEKAAVDAAQPDVGAAARTLPSLALCVEFKRLHLYAEVISRENTRLVAENTGLRSELSGSASLSRENSRLKAQLNASRELTRELSATIAASRENSELAQGNKQLRAQMGIETEESRLSKQLRLMGGPGSSPSSPRGAPGSPRFDGVPMWTGDSIFRYDDFLDADVGAPRPRVETMPDEDDEEAWVAI